MQRTEGYEPSLDKLFALVKDDFARINQTILSMVESDVELVPKISRYLIEAGGKRLRPMLTLASAKLCGYEGDHHIRAATYVELIHTATLLHDDVMDESMLRRGESTANTIWGNKASVLVGDFLLSRSFRLMVQDGDWKVMDVLSSAAVVIVEGEVMQLGTTRNLDVTVEEYNQVIAAKTARLFAASCQLGAVVAKKPEWEQPLYDFGHHLGMAFQVIDDMLDYSAAEDTLGKALGDDFREGKMTLPVISAYAKASGADKELLARTLGALDQKPEDFDAVRALLTRHDALAESLRLAEDHSTRAMKALEALPDNAAKTALLETVDFCLNRAY